MAYDGSIRFDTEIDVAKLTNQWGTIDKIIVGGIAAITASFGAAIKIGSDFEHQVSEIAATLGTTTDQIPELIELAKEAGMTTKFTATQAAEAINTLAQAGYDGERAMRALPIVLDAAAAGNMHLADATTMVTQSVAVMNLSLDEMSAFIDELTVAAMKSNADLSDMGAGVQRVGGFAKIAGMDTAELSTALGILADNGLKASEGGTALRMVLRNLYTPTGKTADALDDLGVVSSDITDGSLRPLQAVLLDLDRALGGLTEAEKVNAMNTIFDQRAIAGANALLKDSGDRWNELQGYIMDSEGAANKFATTLQDNVQGSLNIALAALEVFGITVYDVFSSQLKDSVDYAAMSLNDMTDEFKSPELQQALTSLSSLLADFLRTTVDIATDGLPKLVQVMGFLADNGEKVIVILAGVGAALLVFKTGMAIAEGGEALAATFTKVYGVMSAVDKAFLATNATMVEGAIGANIMQLAIGVLTGQIELATAAHVVWNAVVAAAPLLIAAAAVGVLVGAVVLLFQEMHKVSDETQAFNLQVDTIVTSSDQLTEKIDNNRKAYEDSATAIADNATIAHDLAAEISTLASKTSKTADEQARLKLLIERLNTLVPELNLAYDEQRGVLSKTAEEIDRIIASKQQMIEVSAREARIADLAKEQLELERKRTEVTEKYTEAQQRANQAYRDAAAATNPWKEGLHEILYGQKDYTAEVLETGRATAELKMEMNDLNNTYLRNKEEIERLTEANVLATQRITESAQAGAAEVISAQNLLVANIEDMYGTTVIQAETLLQELTASWNMSSEQIQQALTTTGLSLEDFITGMDFWKSAQEERIEFVEDIYTHFTDIVSSAFETVTQDAQAFDEEVKFENIEANIDSNIKAVENLVEAYGILVSSGIDAGLIQQLYALEPKAGSALISFANQIESGGAEGVKKAQELSDKFKAAAESMPDQLKLALEGTDLAPAAIAFADSLNNQLEAAMKTADYAAAAGFLPQGVADGIANQTSIATDAVDTMSGAMEDVYWDYNQMNSPSKLYAEMSKLIPEGVAQGVNDSASIATDSVKTLANEMKTTFETSVDDSNYSSIGESIVDGVTAGIESASGTLYKAITRMINKALETARQAADAHSPARKFMPLGSDIDEGVAVGILRSPASVDAMRENISAIGNAIREVQTPEAPSGGVYNEDNRTTYGDTLEIGEVHVHLGEGSTAADAYEAGREFRRGIADDAHRLARLKGVLSV